LWRDLDRAARHALPSCSIMLIMMVASVPLLLPDPGAFRAAFVLISVFFWTLYRPAALPAPVVLILGVLLDLIGNSPLGLWAVLLLLNQAAVLALRRVLAKQGFFLVWLALAASMVGTSGLEYLIRSLLILQFLPLGPVLIQAVIGVLLYPLLAPWLIKAHRGAAAPEFA
jgi:rod shape-determining protein MreD